MRHVERWLNDQNVGPDPVPHGLGPVGTSGLCGDGPDERTDPHGQQHSFLKSHANRVRANFVLQWMYHGTLRVGSAVSC